MKTIEINTEYIKLDSFLKFTGEASSGSEAKILILEEKVSVNNNKELQRGKKLRNGDIVEINGNKYVVLNYDYK